MEPFKPKTVAEITAENAGQQPVVKEKKEPVVKRGRKKAEEAKLATEEAPKNTVSVYVRSKGQPTVKGVTADGESCVLLKGQINGKPFEVECDKLVEVSPEIAAVLEPHIALGKGKPHRNPWDK